MTKWRHPTPKRCVLRRGGLYYRGGLNDKGVATWVSDASDAFVFERKADAVHRAKELTTHHDPFYRVQVIALAEVLP